MLQADKKDADALNCQVVATMMKDDFKAALKLIDGLPSDKNFAFHRLYCLYKLKQNVKALKFISSTNDRSKSKGFWHIEAQLRYRLGQYAESAAIYEKQFAPAKPTNKTRPYQADVRANYLACLSQTDANKSISFAEGLKETEWTYSLTYNLAAPLVEAGRLKKAGSVLEKSAELCEKEFKEEGGEDAEELKSELDAVHVMQAYVRHLSGNLEEAEKAYRSLLTSDDKPVVATASTNLVALKQGTGDAKALSSKAVGTALASLSPQQRAAIQMNHCLVSLAGKRGKDLKSSYSSLTRQFQHSDAPALAYASILINEGGKDGPARAEEVLSGHIEACGDSKALPARVALAGVLIKERRVDDGIAVLAGLGEDMLRQPAVVGTIMRLQRRAGHLDKAAEELDAAIGYWKAKGEKGVVATLQSANAELKFRLGEHKAAAEAYEAMAMATGEVKHLCGLVASSSHFDIDKATKFAKKLPALDEPEDLKALENLPVFGAKAEVQKFSADAKAVPKRKRKRKKRLPKNYDPEDTPDPERWLPKWERSYNKRGRGKRRNKNAMLRGPQGGAVRADLAASLDKSKNPDKVDEKKSPATANLGSRNNKRRNRKKKGKK